MKFKSGRALFIRYDETSDEGLRYRRQKLEEKLRTTGSLTQMEAVHLDLIIEEQNKRKGIPACQ